jgi:hypothetical protein
MLRGMEVHATLYWDYFLQITTSKLASGYRIAEGFPELHCDKYKTRVICTVQYHTVFGDRVPCFALVSDPRTHEGAQRAYQHTTVSQVCGDKLMQEAPNIYTLCLTCQL